jgi:hypothetical protein
MTRRELPSTGIYRSGFRGRRHRNDLAFNGRQLLMDEPCYDQLSIGVIYGDVLARIDYGFKRIFIGGATRDQSAHYRYGSYSANLGEQQDVIDKHFG